MTSPTERLYLRRREFIADGRGDGGRGCAGGLGGKAKAQGGGAKLPNVKKGPFATDEALTPYEDVTTYNNFYEFGTDKDDPGAQRAARSRREPWTVQVDGAVRQEAGDYHIDDLAEAARARGAHLPPALRRGAGRW